MSGLEDLLSDAYRDAASTVAPGSIRGLGEPAAPRVKPVKKPAKRRPRHWGRALAPLAAAAAVVAIVVLAAVALRPSPSRPQASRGWAAHRRPSRSS